MYAKVFFSEIGDLVRLSRLVGQAPCKILGTNNAMRESDLLGKEVFVDVEMGALVRNVGSYYIEDDEGRVKMV